MKIAIVGPVGVGKGTQGQRLSRMLMNYTRISPGDLIRDQIEAKTKLGSELRRYADRGEPVPDEEVMRLVLPHLQPAGFWILDGLPRTTNQARALDAALQDRFGGLNHMVFLEGPSDDELVARVLAGRVQSFSTGMSYHTEHDPPPNPEDRWDAGPFFRRSDDTEEALRNQLAFYHREADALKEHYEQAGVLRLIDARGTADEVFERLLDALDLSKGPGEKTRQAAV